MGLPKAVLLKGGGRGHPPPDNFEISSSRKRDFRHSEEGRKRTLGKC